jgi:RHS repeat-associated protein
MQQASSAFSTGVPALAAIPQLAGNSRQGFGLVDGTMRWASGWVISSTSLGIKGSLYDGDAGSRSTGKERDTESGNDYFLARYYGSNMGRFMSPDPSGLSAVNPSNPQTWNLYVYALNNPLAFTDPTGLDCVYFTDDAKGVESVDHDSNDKECGKNGGAWVTGYTDSSYIAQASNGNWNIGSYDKDNVYFTQVMTPDQSASGVSNFFGFSCSGGSSCQVGSASADRLDLQEQLSPTGGSVFAMLQWAVKQTNGVPFGQDQTFGNGSGWCGKGGSGVPIASGWACMAHDYNYELSGNSWPGHNADPTQSWQGGPQLQRINQQLCTHSSNILIQEFFSQGYNSTLGIGSTWGCQ